MDAWLRRALREHLVDDPGAPLNYSLVVAEAARADERSAGLHVLYRGCLPVVRSRSLARVVEGLLAYLGGHPGAPRVVGLLRLEAFAAVRGGMAIVAPSALRYRWPHLPSLLRREGCAVVDALIVGMDPGRGELVVAAPALRVAEGLETLPEADVTTSRADPSVAPGRYPLSAWWSDGGSSGRTSRAEVLAQALRRVRNARELGGQRTLDGLALLLEATPCGQLPAGASARDTARLLAGTARSR